MQKRNVLKNLGMIVILSVAVAVGLNCLLLFIDMAQYSESYREAAAILYSPPFGQQILYSGILIPIVEELLFRGGIFRVLRKWLAFPWAMIISAVIFGAYHGNLVQFVYAGICGLLLAYLYEKYDTVIVPILSHMVMNIASVVLTQIGTFAWLTETGIKTLITIIICVAISSVLLGTVQKLDVTKVLKKYCKDISNDI